jgi:hypothetical protein
VSMLLSTCQAVVVICCAASSYFEIPSRSLKIQNRLPVEVHEKNNSVLPFVIRWLVQLLDPILSSLLRHFRSHYGPHSFLCIPSCRISRRRDPRESITL